MKHNLFPKLNILAYVKRIDVSFHPGRQNSELCRSLVNRMSSKGCKKQFPNLQHSYKILGYDQPSSIEIEMSSGKIFSFRGDKFSLDDLHLQIDEEQHKAHLATMQRGSIENIE